MLTFAQGQGWVSQNVARSVRIKTDERSSRGPLREGVDFPSRTELRTMIEAAPSRWRPFLVTATFTGMRASELRGLIWADVDLDAGMIHVRRRADAWKKMGVQNPRLASVIFLSPPWSSTRCASGLKFVRRVNWGSFFRTGGEISKCFPTSSNGSGSRCRSSAG